MTDPTKAHIPEEQISSCVDGQERPETIEDAEAHVESCPECRRIRDEMSEVTRIFRELENVEPPSYLWNRISAALEEETPAARGLLARWGLSPLGPSWLRAQAWALAATLAIGAGVGALYWSSARTERRQLAEIDRAYRVLLPQDAESYNPFAPSPWINTDINPFSRGGGRTGADESPAVRVKR